MNSERYVLDFGERWMLAPDSLDSSSSSFGLGSRNVRSFGVNGLESLLRCKNLGTHDGPDLAPFVKYSVLSSAMIEGETLSNR